MFFVFSVLVTARLIGQNIQLLKDREENSAGTKGLGLEVGVKGGCLTIHHKEKKKTLSPPTNQTMCLYVKQEIKLHAGAAVLVLDPLEGSARQRQDVGAWEDTMSLFRCRSWRRQPKRTETEFWQQGVDEMGVWRWRWVGGGVVAMLYCSAEYKQTLLMTPLLIGSGFGRVTFLLCGQLHLWHAHFLTQDDGGVGVAAQWRLGLTWGEKTGW